MRTASLDDVSRVKGPCTLGAMAVCATVHLRIARLTYRSCWCRPPLVHRPSTAPTRFNIATSRIATWRTVLPVPCALERFTPHVRSFVHALRTLPVRALSRSSAERPHTIAPPTASVVLDDVFRYQFCRRTFYGAVFGGSAGAPPLPLYADDTAPVPRPTADAASRLPVYAASRWTTSISSLKSPHVHGNCFVPADAALRSFSTVSPGAFAAKRTCALARSPPPPASASVTAPLRVRLRPRHSARARSLPPPPPPPPRRPCAFASAPATAPVRARFCPRLRLRHGARARSLPPPPASMPVFYYHHNTDELTYPLQRLKGQHPHAPVLATPAPGHFSLPCLLPTHAPRHLDDALNFQSPRFSIHVRPSLAAAPRFTPTSFSFSPLQACVPITSLSLALLTTPILELESDCMFLPSPSQRPYFAPSTLLALKLDTLSSPFRPLTLFFDSPGRLTSRLLKHYSSLPLVLRFFSPLSQVQILASTLHYMSGAAVLACPLPRPPPISSRPTPLLAVGRLQIPFLQENCLARLLLLATIFFEKNMASPYTVS
ncbi:hypothetical protein C8J57DRAFT_1545438 [Mycena rebaudengoi]|nr:hypothetical protein C8J57DRAFT_1545438 [Mycena rebaudengoi]